MAYQYPCKGCQERHRACWDTCEKYLAVKAKVDAARAEERKHTDAKNHIVEMVNKNRDHDNKKRRSGRHHVR